MSQFFLELFSEEIPVGLQINLRDKILEEFQIFFQKIRFIQKKTFLYLLPIDL